MWSMTGWKRRGVSLGDPASSKHSLHSFVLRLRTYAWSSQDAHALPKVGMGVAQLSDLPAAIIPSGTIVRQLLRTILPNLLTPATQAYRNNRRIWCSTLWWSKELQWFRRQSEGITVHATLLEALQSCTAQRLSKMYRYHLRIRQPTPRYGLLSSGLVIQKILYP